MDCKKCGIEGQIARSRNEAEGDQSPDTVTKIFTVMEVECRNPQCEHFKKVIETIRVPIYEGE